MVGDCDGLPWLWCSTMSMTWTSSFYQKSNQNCHPPSVKSIHFIQRMSCGNSCTVAKNSGVICGAKMYPYEVGVNHTDFKSASFKTSCFSNKNPQKVVCVSDRKRHAWIEFERISRNKRIRTQRARLQSPRSAGTELRLEWKLASVCNLLQSEDSYPAALMQEEAAGNRRSVYQISKGWQPFSLFSAHLENWCDSLLVAPQVTYCRGRAGKQGSRQEAFS